MYTYMHRGYQCTSNLQWLGILASDVHVHAQRIPVYEQSSMIRYTSKSSVVNKNLHSILKERFGGENHSMKNGGTTCMLWTHSSFCHVYKWSAVLNRDQPMEWSHTLSCNSFIWWICSHGTERFTKISFEMVRKFNWLLLYMRISTFSFWLLPVCKGHLCIPQPIRTRGGRVRQWGCSYGNGLKIPVPYPHAILMPSPSCYDA